MLSGFIRNFFEIIITNIITLPFKKRVIQFDKKSKFFYNIPNKRLANDAVHIEPEISTNALLKFIRFLVVSLEFVI